MKRQGGSAFPSPGVVLDTDKDERQQGAYEGMTLRDYFAAKAMQTLVAYWTADLDKEMAERSYEIADAMLVARIET